MHPSMPQVLVWFCLCPLFRGVKVRTWDELPVQSCLYRERPPSHLYPITNLFYPLGRFLSSYSIRCLRSLTLLCLSSVVVQVFLQSLLVWFQVNFLKFWSCNARVHLVPVLPAHCLLVYSIFFHPHWALAWNLSHALPSPSHFLCSSLTFPSWVSSLFSFKLKQGKDELRMGLSYSFFMQLYFHPWLRPSWPWLISVVTWGSSILHDGDRVTLPASVKLSWGGSGACWSFVDLSNPSTVKHLSFASPIISVRPEYCLLPANIHWVCSHSPSPLFALLSIFTGEAISFWLHTNPDISAEGHDLAEGC